MRQIQVINIMEKFSLFEKQWTPHIIGEQHRNMRTCRVPLIKMTQ